jgi:N-carbamoylputrescine amidase
MAFLVCGDLFDDAIVAGVRDLGPDCVLFPFARSFSDGSFDQQRWEREEQAAYVGRATMLGCTTLMVNGLDDPTTCEYPSFGGAMVVSRQGDVTATWPLGRPGTLYADV